jgi:adenosylcobinamide kinase / adenosylcobinamide-phosphate guanylyltransferase
VTGAAAGAGKVVLVGGGARSGKSAFALAYAERLGPRRAFVATAQAFDEEMAARIARHRAERGATFVTLEEPLHIEKAITWASEVDKADVIVVDCLTLWITNLLLRGDAAEAIERAAGKLAAAAARPGRHILFVTNEVGLGLVPETPLGRVFRDVAGRVHQRFAAVADEIYFAAMGVILRLRPDPVTALRPGEAP